MFDKVLNTPLTSAIIPFSLSLLKTQNIFNLLKVKNRNTKKGVKYVQS